MNTIKFTSRASVKIGDSYYTFEACIERQTEHPEGSPEYEDFKKALWDEVHNEVDTQIEDTLEFLKKKR